MRKLLIYLLCVFLHATTCSFADSIDNKIDDNFFEALKLETIETELKSNGIDIDRKYNFEELKAFMQNTSIVSDEKRKNIAEEIEKLYNAEYIYITLDGEQYSSLNGYQGKAEIIDENLFVSEKEVIPMNFEENSLKASSPYSIHGGTTGAFKREQLGYDGFDGIVANLIIPKATMNTSNREQAWVYYGFDSSSGKSIEGGFAYQTGTNRWLPYVRSSVVPTGFNYGTISYSNTGTATVNNFKFYVKVISGSVKATLIDGATNVVAITDTPFTTNDLSNMSVKRVTSIAKNGFDGNNIYGKSEGQRWANARVSKTDSDMYPSWSSYPLYSHTVDGIIYGTVDCTDSYVHTSGSYVSIYK